MGANMQKQAVPLVRAEAPYIGTGVEVRAALDAADMIVAADDGVATEVSGDLITVEYRKLGKRVYKLLKFERSNQDTCINQKPLVREATRSAEDILAEGPSTDNGELALGKNLLTAFMPWKAYNFEDAIILSERLVRDDVLTSIHIHEHEIDARDTKLGPEEITDIPNLSEDILKDLDERASSASAPRSTPATCWWARSRPRAKPSSRPRSACCGPSSARRREVRDTSLKVPTARVRQGHRRQGVPRERPRERFSGREPLGPGVRRPEAQDLGRRQAGRAPRQQGRHLKILRSRRRTWPTARRSTSSRTRSASRPA